MKGLRDPRDARAASTTSRNRRAGNATQQGMQLPFWGDAAHWNWYEYYETIQAGRRQSCKTVQNADIDGDGRDELIARGPQGILAARYDAMTGQWLQLPDGPVLSDAGGFGSPQYHETLQTADIDGDGKAELLVRDSGGIAVFQFDPVNLVWNELPRGPGWSDAANWDAADRYQTIQCGDVDRDGQDELVGRDGAAIELWKYVPDASQPHSGQWRQLAYDPQMHDANGWTLPRYYETIQLGAVQQSGQAALVYRDADCIYAWWFDPSGSSPQWYQLAPVYLNGDWDPPQCFQTIQCGDIDGDGVAELLARDSFGVHVWKYHPSIGGWTLISPVPAFSDADGWADRSKFATIQTADIDGDGAYELLGRSAEGIEVWKYDTGSLAWVQLPAGPPWSDANGWDQPEYYATIQTARALLPGDHGYTGDGKHAQAVLIARHAYGMLSHRYDAIAKQWVQTSAPFPSFTASRQAAFEQLDRALRGIGANGNIRSAYNDESAPFGDWMSAMYPTAPLQYDQQPRPETSLALPNGISQDDWDAVTWQIWWEISWVVSVNDWYGTKTNGLIADTYLSQDLTLQTVGNLVNLPSGDNGAVALSILSLVSNGLWAILGIPALDAGTASAVAGVVATAASAAAEAWPGNGGSFQTTYDQLQEQLGAAFGQMLAGNEDNQFAITGGSDINGNYVAGDYGLLSAIGQQIQSTIWSWPSTTESDVVTTMQRAYAIGCWQALVPLVWSTCMDDTGPPPPGYPPQFLYVSNGGAAPLTTYWLCGDCDNGANVTALHALFDSFTTDCGTTCPFPLGVPVADVYTGVNGWPTLYQWNCTYLPPAGARESRLPNCGVELRASAVLTRHPVTDDIVAAIELANHGVTAATRLEITRAYLSRRHSMRRRSPTSSLPTKATRLAQGRSRTFHLIFPARNPDQWDTLRVMGTHLAGAFDFELCADIPPAAPTQ